MAFDEFSNGAVRTIASINMTVPQQDGFCTASPTELVPTVTANIAWATPNLTVGATSLSVLQATCSTGNTTAKVHCDLSDLILRSTTGKGATILGINVSYTFTTQPLTAVPSCAVITQTFAAPQQAAAAPVANAVAAGAITPVPAVPTLTVPAAASYFTTGFTFATPLVLNNPQQRALAELAFPLTNGTVLQIASVTVLFANSPL